MRIPSKIILGALLLVAVIGVSYFIYKANTNTIANMPIVKDEVKYTNDVDNNALSSNTSIHILASDTLNNNQTNKINFFDLNISQMNEVATFTESIGNMVTIITYPKYFPKVLDEIKKDYEKLKLDIGDHIYATDLEDGVTGKSLSSYLQYNINYKGVNILDKTTGKVSNIATGPERIYSLNFDKYVYMGGSQGTDSKNIYMYNSSSTRINTPIR